MSGATLYGIADNRAFMGTKAKPGPMFETVQGAIDFWRQTGKLVWPEVKAAGGKPYAIPAGASVHKYGGLGYVGFAEEVRAQEKQLGFAFD